MFDGTIIKINDSSGEVSYASVVNKNQILYEVRPPREYAKIYLVNEDFSNPKCIGDGFTPLWSPNGKWFLARKAEYDKENLDDKMSKHFGFKIIQKPTYSIYNYLGKKILDIKNHDDVSYIKWAPASDKIVLKEFDEGFYIIYLKSVNDKLEIEKEYHFEGFAKEGENVAFTIDPNWSPDGNWIALNKSIEDGHRILENSLYIYNPKSDEKNKIISYDDQIIQKITWISDHQLLILLVSNDGKNEMVVNKISIETLIK